MKIEKAYKRTTRVGDCRIWLGAMCSQGRPLIHVPGAGMRQLNRILWEQKNGPIPDGHRIVMTCRRIDCIEREHMVQMTRSESAAFAAAGGAWQTNRARIARVTSPRVHAKKLTIELAREIRARLAAGTETQTSIAKAYGVSDTAVKRIKCGLMWAEARMAPNSSVFHMAA